MSTAGNAPTRDLRPGRTCPADYQYPAGALLAADDGQAEVLYVAGGLYGNTEALEALRTRASREGGPVRVILAGDFHWFDVAPQEFRIIAQGVEALEAVAGNVERELAGDDSGAGCGCAYPTYVADAVVERSNAIIAQLQETARTFSAHRAWMSSLPAFRAVQVASERVLILHGDTRSLAGWSFAAEVMPEAPQTLRVRSNIEPADITRAEWITQEFRRLGAKVIACSHTCLPFARRVRSRDWDGLLINNGAAGMPNFRGSHCGIITRIAAYRAIPEGSLYGSQIGALRCDALALEYDPTRWWARFRRQWPQGSPADLNYAQRMLRGPEYDLAWASVGLE
jgi:hypothetical protein